MTTTQPLVSGERNEALQEALRFIDEAAQRWNNRLTFHRLRLVERYVKGELGIALQFRNVSMGPTKSSVPSSMRQRSVGSSARKTPGV